jgi:hypothetical protein
MANSGVLEAPAERLEGSSPSVPTKFMNKEIENCLMNLDINPVLREYMLDYIIRDDFYKFCIVNPMNDSPDDEVGSLKRR